MTLAATRPSRQLRQALAFYGIAVTLVVCLSLFAEAIGHAVLLFAMFTPLAAVLITRIVLPDDDVRTVNWDDLGLASLGLRFWPMAFLLPFAVLLPGYLVLWISGVIDVSPAAPQSGISLLIAKAATGFFLSLIWTAAEEIGWRGYLLPRLVETMGPFRASLVTGFLHGLWHVPLILLTPFYHGEGNPLVVVPLFLCAVTLSGPIFGYFRIASGSLVPAILVHAAWNNYWEFFSGATVAHDPRLGEYLAGESGLVTLILLLAVDVALWLWHRHPETDRADVMPG